MQIVNTLCLKARDVACQGSPYVISPADSSPLSQAFRPLTGPMQHAQNDNRIIHYTVRCDIGRARDHQFGSRAPVPDGRARLFRQQSNRLEDTLSYLSCRSRVDLRDILPYSLQIADEPGDAMLAA